MTTSLRRLSLAVAIVVVAIDQTTKHWAIGGFGNRGGFSNGGGLSDGRVIDIVWTLRFNLSFNSGMAFSQGKGIGPFIAILGIVVVAFLLSGLRSKTKSGAVFVGLVAGGALGNIVDRAFRGDAWLRGSVVDFIDLQWWPIFNVADMAICIGGVLLVLTSLDRKSL